MVTPDPPYADAHLLYTFSGSLPGGEIWSTGFHSAAANTAPGDLQGFADQAAAAFVAFWNATDSLGQLNPPVVTFDKATVRQLAVSGKTVFVAEAVPASATVGIGGGPLCPNQTAVVVTTRTAVAGRSARGRMYLPLLSPSLVATSGRLVPLQQQSLATAAASLLGKFILITSTTGAAAVGPFPAAIQSRVAGFGANQIISVQVGDVLDTQRRRRDKLIENYFSQPLTNL